MCSLEEPFSITRLVSCALRLGNPWELFGAWSELSAEDVPSSPRTTTDLGAPP
jgi:hypothetical protein